MTENLQQVALQFPPIQAANQTNAVLYLENVLSVADGLPNPCYITKVRIWCETGGVIPAGTGNVAVAIDPGKAYITASGFPATQNVNAVFLKTLADWELLPDTPFEKVEDFNPPVVYNPGVDAIIFAPEFVGLSGTLQIWVQLWVQATGDFPLPASQPDVIFDQAVTNVSQITTLLSIRHMILINAPAPLGQVRVHVQALTEPETISGVSVGIQSGSTSSTVAPPVEATFGGASGFSIPNDQGLWSDWVNLPTTEGENLAVTVTIPANTYWAYRPTSTVSNYSSGIDNTLTAAMQGTVSFQANRSHVIDMVEVQ